MLRQLKNIVVKVIVGLQIGLLRAFRLRGDKQSIVVFDIDNTIAQTHEYRPPGLSRYGRRFYYEVPPCLQMVDCVRNIAVDRFVVFVTARPFWTHNITRNWLKRNIGTLSSVNLVTVCWVTEKVNVLEALSLVAADIKIVDDLTYEDDGIIRTYEQVRAQFKALGVDHYGLDFINEVNGGGSSVWTKLL